ncbi:MAG: LPS-assembly protein LptD, partial [Alcaligenaceae bacterium]|nr:LPS-assembly protein LptD [Alcaligenaceae bacterium]
IKSRQVDLHFDENEGIARHGRLYFKNVPILYSPYLTFPIRKERKSGFLMPTYGTSTAGGMEFSVPYYFNLAPNYDLTLVPRIMAKRGVQLGSEFRYLGHSYSGTLEGTYLNSDREADRDRWYYGLKHHQALGGGLRANFDVRRVSDDDYFRDFSAFGLNEASTSWLASSASLSWAGSPYLSSSVAVYKYQTLQDSGTSYRPPQYDKLPEFHLRAARYDWGGFDVVSENYATRFSMPFYSGTLSVFDEDRDKRRAPDGDRFTSYTTIAYPIVRAGWYLTPQVGLHLSQYNVDWYGDELRHYQGRDKTHSRAVPIFSIDSGLTFERDASLFGNAAIQTLEPRLYYLYVPYRDQSQLPVFDTAYSDFSFSQAFSENIFSGGWDRIANANQLTIGLTSRWLDADTGFERLSLSLAQRRHFSDQRVFLWQPDERPVRSKSDYLVGVNAAVTDKLSVRFDGQFSPESNSRNRMTTGVRWEPKRLASVSAWYRYQRDAREIRDPGYEVDPDDDLGREQVTLAGQWPLSNRWYALGRYDYSLKESRSTQSILGLEYKGDCCWSARVVLQRYAVARQEANTAVFFQLELSGLGGIGSDPMSLIRERVVGYQDINTPIPEKTVFERYQ